MNQHTRATQDRGPTTDEDQVDLRAIGYSLYAAKWLILAVMAVCFVVTAFYLNSKPPVYSSNVLFQVEKGDNNLFGLNSGGGLGYNTFSSAEMQSVLIKSRYILEPVVKSLGMDLVIGQPHFPVVGGWYARHHDDHLSKPLFGLSQYAWGGERLSIGQFTVPMQAENSSFTLIAGKAPGTYDLYSVGEQKILHGRVGELVEKNGFSFQVTQLVANPDTPFSIYKKNSQPIAAGLASGLKIKDLSDTMNTGVLEMSLEGSNPTELVKVLNAIAKVSVEKNIEKKSAETTKTLQFLNLQIPLVKQEINTAETALNQYRAKSGKVDFDLQTKFLLSQITDTQKLLEEIKLERLEALQKDTPEHPAVIAFDEKENSLKAVLQELQAKLSKLPVSDQKGVALLRDVKVKNQLYLVLLNKVQSVQVSQASTVSDIRILALANYPDAPLPNKKGLILLGSLLVGFALGAAFIIGRNMTHRKIMDPNVIDQQFGLANMAIVPHSEQQKIFVQQYNKKQAIPLLAKSYPKDLSIEALRSFRTSLQFAMVGARNNIITIMGVAPGVGKSFISSNFAYLLADAGKKILLIDGDIRRGHLKNYFAFQKRKGFSEILSDQCTLDQVLVKVSDNLDFLPTGMYPPNPSELLMNERLGKLLNHVSPLYDLVIIDTASILAVTDAAVIGQHAGANFMVIASNTHEAGEIDLALKRLSANNIQLNGCIFNFSSAQGLSRYSYGYYSYNYQTKYE